MIGKSDRQKRIPHSVDDLTIKENADKRFENDKEAAKRLEVFSITLNHLMADKGIDQVCMAQDLGISTGALSKYRNGLAEPGLTTIIKIASYLEVDCSYLMTGISSRSYRVNREFGLSEESVRFLRRMNIREKQFPLLKSNPFDCFVKNCWQFLIVMETVSRECQRASALLYDANRSNISDSDFTTDQCSELLKIEKELKYNQLELWEESKNIIDKAFKVSKIQADIETVLNEHDKKILGYSWR